MKFIQPTWNCPGVTVLTTTRQNGVSNKPYDSFNLALHVGDDPEHVLQNRERLDIEAKLPQSPLWLNQTHSNTVITAENYQPNINADAIIATQPHHVCVIQTADCLPICLAEKQGRAVAAIHAGWRGLADGIIEATIHAMPFPASTLMAWIGPAISSDVYEVGEDVRNYFVTQDNALEKFFQPHQSNPQKYFFDLPGMAASRLKNAGISPVVNSNLCTYSDSENFFSFRRDGQSGRQATLIWIA